MQAMLDSFNGKSGIVPDSGEPLLLSSRNDFPVTNERRRAVMVERGDPKDVHCSAELEGCYLLPTRGH